MAGVEATELCNALDVLSKAWEAKLGVDAYQALFFRPGKLAAHGPVLSVEVDTGLDLTAVVNGATFRSIVEAFKGEQLELSIKRNSLHIESGTSKYNVALLEANEPGIDDIKVDCSAAMVPEDFDVLKRVALSLNPTAMKFEYRSICMELGGKQIRFWATDGVTLTTEVIPPRKLSGKGESPVFLSAPFVGAVLAAESFAAEPPPPIEAPKAVVKGTKKAKAAKEAPPEPGWALGIGSRALRATMGRVRIFGRVLAVEKPPGYNKILRSILEGDLFFFPVTSDLKAALGRVRLLGDIIGVAAAPEGGTLVVYIKTPSGQAEEQLEVPPGKSEDADGKFDSRKLIKGLSYGDEAAISSQAFVVRAADESYYHLVATRDDGAE